MKKIATALGAIGLIAIGASTGSNCQVNAKTQAEIQAAIALGDCIEVTVAADSQETPQPAPLQIAADCATACGATAANLANLFVSSSDPLKAAVAAAAAGNVSQIDAIAARKGQ